MSNREFVQPVGWKHFAMDKFDKVPESEESDFDSSSSSTLSDNLSDSPMYSLNDRNKRRDLQDHRTSTLLSCGVSKKHPPIYTHLVQICILANHAVGKDTHVRGIKVFGPATVQSREKAKTDAKKNRESRRITGSRAVRLRQEKEAKRRVKAKKDLRQWVESEGDVVADVGADTMQDDDSNGDHVGDDQDRDILARLGHRIPTSRTLELLSTLR
jgi:hypothetical protein